jgi:hypothetical protein
MQKCAVSLGSVLRTSKESPVRNVTISGAVNAILFTLLSFRYSTIDGAIAA